MMPRIGHHRLSARCLHGLGDLAIGTGDHNRADTGFYGTAPDMYNHGLAVNIRQYFSGKPGGGKARGDNNDGIFRQTHRKFIPRSGCKAKRVGITLPLAFLSL